MIIIVSARVVEWSRSSICYDEVLSLSTPPCVPDATYVVRFARHPWLEEHVLDCRRCVRVEDGMMFRVSLIDKKGQS